MSNFLQYLLESSACLALFYGLYHIVLRRDSFHNLLRAYIIFSIVASLLIPITPNAVLPKFPKTIQNSIATLPIKETVPIHKAEIAKLSKDNSPVLIQKNVETITNPSEKRSSVSVFILKFLFIIYVSGALFFLIRFLFNIQRIILLIRKNEIEKKGKLKIIYLKFDSPSFSFLNFIFLRKDLLSPSDEQQIIAHETVHASQKHTLDILFIELAKIVYWFNPFIWLFKSSIVKLHEFYADEQLLKQSQAPEKYKELLLKQYLGNFNLELTHPFNSSLLKTRIAMMGKAKSGKVARLKLMLALPILAIGLFAFAKAESVFSRNELSQNAKIEALVKYYINSDQFNGNILVYKNDRLTYEKSHGYADLKSKQELNINTPFLLGLVSESFTSVSIMLLKEQGKLTYSDSLAQYFKDLPAFMGSITIQHLLNHTSGIPPADDYFPAESGTTNNKIIYNIIRKMDNIYFKPGTDFRYSSSGYILLALIIEKISHQSYEQFVKSNILLPANMSDTYFLNEQNFFGNNRAIGYNAKGEIFDYPQFTQGNSGIVSTVFDLRKFETALYSGSIISLDELHAALKPTKLENGKEIRIGLGFELYGKEDENIAGHYSWYGGTKAMLWTEIDKKNSIIALTNNSWPRFWEMIAKISRILGNKPYSQPIDRQPIAISTNAMELLAGNYIMDNNKAEIVIKIENNKPYVSFKHSDESYELYAEAANEFFIKEYDLQFTFQKNEKDSITGLILHSDEDIVYSRVQ